jgi:hypothetical protein
MEHVDAPDPAVCAALMRGYIAEHATERERNAHRLRVVLDLQDHLDVLAFGLTARNTYLDLVLGRLHRHALEYDADAAREQATTNREDA